MGRPRHLPGTEDTRGRILRAAVEAFARQGFDRATLAEIGRAAGISRPSLLHHFSTKEALYEAVVHQVFEGLGAAIAGALTSEPPWDRRLRALSDAYCGFLTDHPTHARLVARELVEGDGPGARLVRDRALPLLDFVVAALGTGPVRQISLRHALLLVVSDGLLAAAARSDAPDSLGHLLWGPPDPERSWALARTLLLEAP